MGFFKKALFLGGIYGVGVYAGAVAWTIRKDVLRYESEPHLNPVVPEKRVVSIYNDIAEKYSKKITKEELFSGIYFLRFFHLRNAKGHVLEIGSGPGSNFSFYKWKQIQSLSLVDPSEEMHKLASTKAEKKVPKSVQLKQYSQLEALPEESSFDTIVQTFCLCSQENAVDNLNKAKQLLRPGGQMLLIEHGKGKYEWLNKILNAYAESHYESWGCVWNRDINELMKESNLKLDSCKRYNFGTTYVIKAH
ncbi:methyltransferase [Schizosaccharomyces cryophilus OY26]|uniref:Methyltransferase n=1 Tax=Schizosaccharomyces cryophilus (strain OY26 / ATCC MYA-4695 / CBS 11777 / NBRC 106824 / NRRL Y48691) TaxID=653667 RepID=S9W6R5_SCHCR|nr:methyltransferase [Schizosaccharomyces cryophilus OY26]EPY53565.1 methyltransferase [Schizosaccharomyces cryophilus OY26]